MDSAPSVTPGDDPFVGPIVPLNGDARKLVDRTREILHRTIHEPGSAFTQDIADSPTRGATVSLGSLTLELKQGTFRAHAFESLTDRSHIIALSKGDITTEDPLLIRVHSECITSETLGGCDCDCVEQLEGALQAIADEGRGVVFYLRQEGRGAGYSLKGRDRMMVCASENEVETFEAYKELGLAPDERRYERLRDVSYLLGIQAPLKVMTNNPDKIAGLESLGFVVEDRRPLTIDPNPHNAYYLNTKGQNGHMLGENGTSSTVAGYPWKVETFAPHRLPDALRFSHNASYPLPIRPMEGALVLSPEDFYALQDLQAEGEAPLVHSVEGLSFGKFRVQLTEAALKMMQEDPKSSLAQFVGHRPHWFNDHIYHDSVTGLDFVALTYAERDDIVPLVRVHSENLLDRFPLADEDETTKYQQSIDAIVSHGRGMLLLYPEDGRGKGFSSTFLERRLVEEGHATNSTEASQMLGLGDDRRDYDALAQLILHHCPEGRIRLIFTSQASIERKKPFLDLLKELGVDVEGYEFLQ
ncbi:MAG: GTP cyclohydrolase II RibA [Bdellovibrionales bacterium]|nr:GTP cyclohydrolase II RibA [Bdellovibrionales bacterium]